MNYSVNGNNNSLALYLRTSNINTIHQQIPCLLAKAGTIVTHWLKSHSQEMPYITAMNLYIEIGCVLYTAVQLNQSTEYCNSYNGLGLCS